MPQLQEDIIILQEGALSHFCLEDSVHFSAEPPSRSIGRVSDNDSPVFP
jgi:hypothetical protein